MGTTDTKSTWKSFLQPPLVALILGFRGSGKSGLGYWLLERMHTEKFGAAVYRFPSSHRGLVPEYVQHIQALAHAPRDSVLLVDEGSLQFHARRSMTTENLAIGNLVDLSRQRNQVILFIVHHSRKLDVNLVAEADLLMFKRLSKLHVAFERREIQRIAETAMSRLAAQKGDERQWTYVMDAHRGRAAVLKNNLPSFWSQELSIAYALAANETVKAPRRKE